MYHIIVNKTCGMQQLKSQSSQMAGHRNLAVILSTKEDEHRTHTLSPTLTNMVEHLTEQTFLLHQSGVEQLNKVIQISLYGPLYER
jgi:hypothetical protein